jgi:hypothetical protein
MSEPTVAVDQSAWDGQVWVTARARDRRVVSSRLVMVGELEQAIRHAAAVAARGEWFEPGERLEPGDGAEQLEPDAPGEQLERDALEAAWERRYLGRERWL